jgi:hypothetical protein
MTQGPRLQIEPVQAQDSSTTINVVFDETSGNIAIDYTDKYERIATALERMAELAEGPGIHTATAFDWLGLMSIYKLYVDNPDTAIGLEELKAYKAKIDSLPKSF